MTQWLPSESVEFKYARFLGIEAALFERDSSTPFGESLTPGIIPDQTVTFTAAGQTKVIWVQLTDSLAGNNQVIYDDKRNRIQTQTKFN